MSDREMHFPAMSNYPKNSDTAIAVDAVEAWLDQFPHKRAENKPNGGIVQSIADTKELFLRPMSSSERKVAVAKARREHREALKNLAKQEEKGNKKIARQLAKWRKEGKPKPTAAELAAKKEAQRLRRNELNRIRREAEKQGKTKLEMPSKKGQEMLDKLKADGVFYVADWDMKRKYLSLMITHARKLGYEIESVRSGRSVTHYTMDKQ